jgi:TonB family protein
MKTFIAAALAAVALAAVVSPAEAGRNHINAAANAGVAPVTTQALQSLPAVRTFPSRLTGVHLHRADRLAHQIKAAHAEGLTAQVKLCVAPNGAVSEAQVVGSSGMGAFDKIVLDAARSWSYQQYAAPSGTRVCDVVSILYRAP